MNKSFLEYVAADILQKYGKDLSDIALVFPNKRASLFMNEYLARCAGEPVWSPDYMTISDLFRQHSTLEVADNLKLVADLHRSFCHCTGSAETLDRFLGWGLLLLSDFDDMDKNMADARKVLANVKDIHEMDDLSYLTTEQQELLRHFFSCFDSDHLTEMKKRFLNLWSHLYDIYTDFNQRLHRQGLAYEGALYKEVAVDPGLHFTHRHYLFVGFNVVQKVEQRLFSRLQEEGKAHFYWDFDHYYMKGSAEAGHYIKSYLSAFPNELDNSRADIYDHLSQPKSIRVMAASTEDIQARYISTWLREGERLADGRQTAIVLCNEKLLPTVIHCLPDELDKVNITTGYPLQLSALYSLVNTLTSLQTMGYIPRQRRFRLSMVNRVLRHPYAHYLSDRCAELYDELNVRQKTNYPTLEQLGIDTGCRLLFSDLRQGSSRETSALSLCQWLLRLVKLMGSRLQSATDENPFLKEVTFRTYTILSRLHGLIDRGDMDIDVATLQRLITQLMQTTQVPFHGEPAEGLQVMGVLETRNLDFRHVLLLSCNEGNMPKGVNDTSFIPYSVRKAHGLTTIDNKVSIYAYYFYRLLQRAEDITLVYNQSTDNGTTGEMSRFILQLMVESGQPIRQGVLRGGQQGVSFRPAPVAKTAETMDILLRRFDLRHQLPAGAEPRPLLTPTALNRYLRCPLLFYYYYVLGLSDQPETDPDGMSAIDFGNIFHEASEIVYRRLMRQDGRHVTKEVLIQMLHAEAELEAAVDEAFRHCLFKLPGGDTFLPEYNGLQLINRAVILTYLKRLLEIDSELAPFDILGLETDTLQPMTIRLDGGGELHTYIGGRIDRLDCISDAKGRRIRVVDYKTGSRLAQGLKTADDIFSPDKLHNHSDYYLQSFLYAIQVSQSPSLPTEGLPVSPALLFIQHTRGEQQDPTLRLDRHPVTDVSVYADSFNRQLQTLTEQIFSAAIPFSPTTDSTRCEKCPFRQFCGI